MRKLLFTLAVVSWIIFVVGFIVSFAFPSAEFDRTFAALQKRDYAAAKKEWRLLTDRATINLQYRLGEAFMEGEIELFIPRNYKQAIKWYRLAAAQGHVRAPVKLGEMYEEGMGVEQNPIVAYALYSLATASGPIHNNASNGRDRTKKRMSVTEINAGDTLMLEMSQPGNLLKALDVYLEKHP